MLKIAMFDEVNESTSMFKVASRRRDAPDQGYWLTLDADGFTLPSDWYLRLAGEITEAGLEQFLTALHLNDAREPSGSHRDRHAAPGTGTIGAGLTRLLAHPMFESVPCILELGVAAAEEGIAYLTDGLTKLRG